MGSHSLIFRFASFESLSPYESIYLHSSTDRVVPKEYVPGCQSIQNSRIFINIKYTFADPSKLDTFAELTF